MKNIEKKYLASLQDGGLDADSADFAVGQNKVVNAENVRWGSTDRGVTATVESIGGTRQISSPQPSLTFYTIGSAEDTANSRFIYFKACLTGPWDKIVAYDYLHDVEYDVLLASQVEGGFNFNKNQLIHSARVVDGLLYWTDNYNEPKKINIDSGIKLNNPSYVTDAQPYTTLPDSYEITLIRRPPTYAPTIAKDTDNTFDNNFIATNSWKFAWQYLYFDNEVSVLSMFSTSSKFNTPAEDFNFIRVTLSAEETIPETARIIRLVAIPQNDNPSGIGFVIKTWDKLTSTTPFTNHNNGITQLSFDYYGNIAGEVIDSVTVVTPYHTVPLLSKTIESARQRIYLANNLNGYNTPTTTSLALTANTGTPGANQSVANNWFALHTYMTLGVDDHWMGCYVIYLSSVSPAGYYYIAGTRLDSSVSAPSPGAAPTSEAYSTLTYLGSTISDVVSYWRAILNAEGYAGFYDSTIMAYGGMVTITGLSGSTSLAFKSGAEYRAGVVFYDKAMRKCGVVTSSSLDVQVPNRNYAGTSVVTSIGWTLSNANRLNEIPDWAYYYAPVRTLNQKTRFFVQFSAASNLYAKIDATTNDYAPDGVTFSATGTVGIAINLNALVQAGLGYAYNAGDIAVIIKSDSSVHPLPVLAQSGEYVYVKAENLGDLTSEIFIVEIYTPYIKNDNEPFYEVGQLYPIVAPASANRLYPTLSGTFTGDVFYIKRTYNSADYLLEAMNPNDQYYKFWDTDAGRLNLITLLGQVRHTSERRWSETYIQGTQNNGLSAFYAANAKQLPLECGPISKLQVTSKVNDELGIIMLNICEKETVSSYLQEIQQYGSNTATNLVVAENVIGTDNVLKGSYGTINPESVVEYRGLVFWFDANNGRIIQYSSNGLFPISNYKMTRFWKQFSVAYMGKTQAQIEALGSRPFVFTAVDPHHNELLITIPKLSNTPPKGYLPDLGQEQQAVGDITITDIGDNGDTIEVFVNDPTFGVISLGLYTQQLSDTSNAILAQSIANALSSNGYGYSVTSNENVVIITARNGLGATINGGSRITVNIVSPPKLLIDGTGMLLINTIDKLLL